MVNKTGLVIDLSPPPVNSAFNPQTPAKVLAAMQRSDNQPAKGAMATAAPPVLQAAPSLIAHPSGDVAPQRMDDPPRGYLSAPSEAQHLARVAANLVPIDNRSIQVSPDKGTGLEFENAVMHRDLSVSMQIHGYIHGRIAYLWMMVPAGNDYSLHILDKTTYGGNSMFSVAAQTTSALGESISFHPDHIDFIKELSTRFAAVPLSQAVPDANPNFNTTGNAVALEQAGPPKVPPTISLSSWLVVPTITRAQTDRDYTSVMRTNVNSNRLSLSLEKVDGSPIPFVGYQPVSAFTLKSVDHSARSNTVSGIAIAFDHRGRVIGYSDGVMRLYPLCEDTFALYNLELDSAYIKVGVQPTSQAAMHGPYGGPPKLKPVTSGRVAPLPTLNAIQPADGANLVSKNLAYYVPRARSTTAGPVPYPIVQHDWPTAMKPTQYGLDTDRVSSSSSSSSLRAQEAEIQTYEMERQAALAGRAQQRGGPPPPSTGPPISKAAQAVSPSALA